MELSPVIPLNSCHRFCGMELKHTKRFLALSRHFTAMSAVAFPVDMVRVTSLLTYATKKTEVLLPLVYVPFLYAV